MLILTKVQLFREKDHWLNKLRQGAIVMYPTDTIYGLGCDATNQKAVEKIRLAKQREEKPFSIIAPSKEWITENCIITLAVEQALDKLPGPYTLLLNLKNQTAIAKAVTNSETVGVRIPNHWWAEIVKEFGKPFVTTSVNLSGEPHAVSPWKTSYKLKAHIDFAIEDGDKTGPASKIIDCTGSEIKEIVRN